MRKLSLALVLFVALALAVKPAKAQDPGPTPSPDEINAIAKNMYCPVCANVPVDACGTAACALWRQQIADLLTQGYSPQQIYDEFVHDYGPVVLAAPPPSGFNLLIYVLPTLGILAGAYLLWRVLTAWSRPRPALRNVVAARQSKTVKRLEDQLKARR